VNLPSIALTVVLAGLSLAQVSDGIPIKKCGPQAAYISAARGSGGDQRLWWSNKGLHKRIDEKGVLP